MELKRRARYANIALAVMAPALIIGAILLRHAAEGVQQAFGLATFFLGLALFLVLDVRYERRHGRSPQ